MWYFFNSVYFNKYLDQILYEIISKNNWKFDISMYYVINIFNERYI